MPDWSPQKGSDVWFFGKDIMSIPFLRTAGLTGISIGVSSMILFFLFTSKPRLAAHVGMGTSVGVTWGYWSYLRYKYYLQEMEIYKVTRELQEKTGEVYDHFDSFDSIQ